MLYMERQTGAKQGWSRVFSDTDTVRELDEFRVQLRAPRLALHRPRSRRDRPYVDVFGAPRERALVLLPLACIHNTTLDRVLWERTQPAIMRRHPQPFVTETELATHDAD